MRTKVFMAISFIEAHRLARREFENSFLHEDKEEITEIEAVVLAECTEQVVAAKKTLQSISPGGRVLVVSQIVAAILLNYQAHRIETLKEEGILNEKSATEMFKQVSRELISLHYDTRGECDETTGLCPTDIQVAESVLNAPVLCEEKKDVGKETTATKA